MRSPSPDFESGASAVPPSRATAKSSGASRVARAPRRGRRRARPLGPPACTIGSMESSSAQDGDDVPGAPHPPTATSSGRRPAALHAHGQASAIAADLFGVDGRATPLVSERDQNFRLAARRRARLGPQGVELGRARGRRRDGDGRRAPRRGRRPVAPRRRPARDARRHAVGPTRGADGARHFVRLLPPPAGRNGTATDLSREAIRDFGAVSARLGRATRGYFHPLAGRPILWDVKHLPTCGRTFPWWPTIAAVRSWSRSSTASRAPLLRRFAGFRAQVIHNDLTFDNTLLDAADRVSGIVDFGDMAHTALVLDLVAALVASSAAGRPGRPLRGGGGRDRRVCRRDPARGRGGGPPGRPGRRAPGPDDAHLGVAGRDLPGERGVPLELGRRGLADARAVPGGRAARGAPAVRCRRPADAGLARRGPAGRGCARRRGAARGPPPRARRSPRSPRSPTSGRSTSSAARAPGCTTPTGGPTSTATTTCRWSATPIRGSWRRSPARRPR